jgi:membrane-associated phospholipid phosphatase
MKALYYSLALKFMILNTIPAWPQQNNFPYTKNKKDIVLLPASVALYATSEYLSYKRFNLTQDEIAVLNRNDVMAFDRGATYNWNTSSKEFSEIPFRVLPLLPIALAIPQFKNKKWDNALTYGVMYTEVLLFTASITGTTKSLTHRIRPYLYNTSLTVEERFNLQESGGGVASISFFSGHSSITFAFAVFLSKTYTDIYGKNVWSKVIWGTTLTLAAATAYTRVDSGLHFSTDVIVGAVIGSAIGYMIPELHKTNPEKISLSVLPNQFSLVYKF